MSNTQALKVRLRSVSNGDTVVFHSTPDLTENRNVNYKTLEPVHMPGAIHVYNNTSSRTYSVGNIKLFSRTRDEATMNLHRLNILRSWTMPRFGSRSSTLNGIQRSNRRFRNQESTLTRELMRHGYGELTDANAVRVYDEVFIPEGLGEEHLGAPPAVLELSAYSDGAHRGNVYRVPTVVTNLSIPYPSDVDYVSTVDGTPFPTVMTVDIQLMEVHSPRQYASFSLDHFRRGDLTGF